MSGFYMDHPAYRINDMIQFHVGAQTSFSSAASEVLRDVRAYPATSVRGENQFEIHPNVVVSAEEIIGIPKMTDREIDGTGTETGRFWTFNGQRFGVARRGSQSDETPR
jgi:hypothetical protein